MLQMVSFKRQLQFITECGTPDKFTFPCVLKACAGFYAPQHGKEIHGNVVVSGFECDVFVGNALLDMYAKCGSIVDARHLFEKMSQRDVVSWNVMLAGYGHNGCWDEALKVFRQIKAEKLKPDVVTIVSVLRTCWGSADLQEGREIHDYIRRNRLEGDVSVGNSLVTMYARYGVLEDARHVFDKMPQRDVVSWNTMITGYVQNGHLNEGFELFRVMALGELKPDVVSITSVIKACAMSGVLELGKEVHSYIVGRGFESDVGVDNALITMYGKCGDIEGSRYLFDTSSQRDVVTWNAMISGYVNNGYCDDVLELIGHMEFAGVKLDSVTLASILLACACPLYLLQGKEIHGYIIKRGFESSLLVENALIDMYAKCQSIDSARQLFDRMLKKDVISWNTTIAGYVQCGGCEEALRLFCQMELIGVKPDSATIVSLLPAYSQLVALQRGKELHNYVIKRGFESHTSVANALIDMYTKCGSIEDARHVCKMDCKVLISWTAIITGYGLHGYGKEALILFHQMQQLGMNPDHITLVSILSACSHAGLVDCGWQVFGHMLINYHVEPTMEHYACMVDLLSRAGYLDEAEDFIKKMPFEPIAGIWGSLLGGCRSHHNMVLGERVADCLLKLNTQASGYYVLLSNMYAAVGRWDDVKMIRTTMRAKGLKKSPGCSWIEINNVGHEFTVGERSHPQIEKIHETLESLAGQMEEAGYVPDKNFVLHDVEEEEKQYILCS